MNRIVTANKTGQRLTLKLAKRNEHERFVLVKHALTCQVRDGRLVTTSKPVNGTLVMSSNGDTIYSDFDDDSGGVATEEQDFRTPLAPGNPKPQAEPANEVGMDIAKGGVIFFSTDIDDRNAMWKRRIDTDPSGKQNMVRKYDFSLAAIKSAMEGWAKTMWNRFSRKSKQRAALMEFFNEHKVFVGHTVMPRGEGSYIDPYQSEPDTRPQYSEEQSYIMICKGLDSDLLTELADVIRIKFDQKQVLIQDDNTGRTYLYP